MRCWTAPAPSAPCPTSRASTSAETCSTRSPTLSTACRGEMAAAATLWSTVVLRVVLSPYNFVPVGIQLVLDIQCTSCVCTCIYIYIYYVRACPSVSFYLCLLISLSNFQFSFHFSLSPSPSLVSLPLFSSPHPHPPYNALSISSPPLSHQIVHSYQPGNAHSG